MYKKLLSFLLLFVYLSSPLTYAEEIVNTNSIDIQAVETTQESKYPDYSKMYIGEDKHEKFNRKMFNLNTKLNKYIAKPVHIIWASIMPNFGMDRIRDAYNNIEYPKRLASCILQKDKKGIKDETLRFLTNSTIGLGGLFDPADKIFKIKPTNENMEQALCKCKMQSGSYLVMPCLHACTPRSLCGRALEAALDPCVYLASPIISIVKFGLMVNRTSYMQPLANMIETTYADPYDIHKKLFGIENYIRNSNFDRENLLKSENNKNLEEKNINIETLADASVNPTSDIIPLNYSSVVPDIVLDGYKQQTPVIDSMKTALFENPDINKSFWNELSIWNHSFAKKIKTDSILVYEDRAPYKFKYIMQKDKNSPIIILYPSIGEGAGNHHSVVFAKLFYDLGFSVILQGSHFHWEFVKSMPIGFAPGIPNNDSEYIRLVTAKIVNHLQNKYKCNFKDKYVVGTSFGAVAALFTANKESKENSLNIKKYIAISPPIDLSYALKQLDNNSECNNINSSEIKDSTAKTAAKILQVLDLKKKQKLDSEYLPFSDTEGKVVTSFILRQKLSDIIYTIENIQKDQKTEIYDEINNMSYKDYAEKYLGFGSDNEISKNSTLYSLEDYLMNNDNYRIYQAFDDYFINKSQIKKLKTIAGKHLTCINCGAHLGYLHREEFLKDLKQELSQ